MLYTYASALAKLPLESYNLEQQAYILLLRLKLLDLMTKQIHPQTVNEEFMAFLRGSRREIHLIENKDSSSNKKRSVLAHRIDAKNDIILSCIANNTEPSDLEKIVVIEKEYLASPIEFIKLQQVANVNKTLFAHADFSSEGRLAEIIYNLLEHGFKWPKNFFKELDNTSYFQLQENQISLQKERRRKRNSKDNYIRIDLGQDIAKRKMLSSLIATTYSTEELEEIRKDCHRNPNIFSLHDKLGSFDLSEPLLKEMNKQLRDNGIPEELFSVIIRLILQNHEHSIQKIKLKLVQEITQMYEAMKNANRDLSLLYFYNTNKVMTTAKGQTPYLIPVVAPNSTERKFVLRSTFQLSVTPINDSDEAIPCADVSIDVILTINGNQLSLGIGSIFHCYHSEMANLITYTYGRPKTGRLDEESVSLRRPSKAPEPCALDEELKQVFTPNRKIKQNFGMADHQNSPKPSPKNLFATINGKKIKKNRVTPLSPHTPYTAAPERVTSHFYASPKDAPQPPKRRSTLDSEVPNAATIRVNAAFFSERKINKASESKKPLHEANETLPIAVIQPAIKTGLHLNIPPRNSAATKVISSRSPGLAGLSPGYFFSPTPTPSKTPSSGSARTKVSFSSASTDYRQTPRFPTSPKKLGK